ncbi:MAG: DegT/DnrJ/EryC1/StrS aminotransferase family protein [Ignavibacteriaceae bacterium]
MNIEENYKKEIAKVLKCNPDNIFLYWKGRIALYAILKAIGVESGDEIILPGFTCVVVPNAIIYSGAKPIYVDICKNTYNMDFNLLEQAITKKTKAIICQNTFGLSSNLERIIEIAKRHNIFTIEDCTHGFGGFYNGKPNGSFCDAAFYSTQWNKPFSTGIGGFSVVNNTTLLDKVISLEKTKVKSTVVERIILTLLLLFKNLIVNKYTQWFLVQLYRFFSKKNLVVGSNQGEELSGTKMPENYFKNISFVQIWVGKNKLKKIDKVNQIRKKNAEDYTKFLKSNNKAFVDEGLFNNHLFLKYPLLVKDREKIFKSAKKSNITLGDWFLSPLHPIKGNLLLWNFDKNLFPVASRISEKIVNLPTEILDNKKVINFLKQNIDLIE